MTGFIERSEWLCPQGHRTTTQPYPEGTTIFCQHLTSLALDEICGKAMTRTLTVSAPGQWESGQGELTR